MLVLSYAEEWRRNGEVTRSRASSFLGAIPAGMLDERSTVKVRSTGRAVLSSMFGSGGGYRDRGTGGGYRRGVFETPAGFADDDDRPVPQARRRAGTPVERSAVSPEDESQEVASLAIGSRVKHRKFGSGTIAELTGAGREAKVKIDFDDESIGRKTLVVAQANLEPAFD